LSRLARGALCALLLSLLVPATASAAFGDRPLRLGMEGTDVRMLQTLLTKAGFVTVADGRYGRRTRRSVGRWEGSRDRVVNGAMSRADQLALRHEFKPPISTTGPQTDAAGGLVLLGGKVRPGVTARVSSAGEVVAEVADGEGAVVRTLKRSATGPGELKLRWNGRIARKPAPEGTYLVRLGDAAAGASVVGEPSQFELRHHVFPIAGRHDLGRNAANGFGGGRGHMGQDMFARCGTPVRAAQGGTVVFAGYHAAAGNYLVIRGSASGEDYVYMHLRDAPKLAKGDKVKTGERIAHIGQTGRADGCHLHFELWSKPGWYSGGEAYDPLAKLREWDGWS
jgi:murein DD-endopeptidase MepM/ murein hydrolase activator NlpD